MDNLLQQPALASQLWRFMGACLGFVFTLIFLLSPHLEEVSGINTSMPLSPEFNKSINTEEHNTQICGWR